MSVVKRFKVYSLVLLTAVFVTLTFNCADILAGQQQWSPEYRKRIAQRSYPFTYSKVFESIIKSLSENGYILLFRDKNNGMIITDYKSAGGFLASRGEVKFSFRVEKSAERSTLVALTIQCRVYTMDRGTKVGDDLISEDDYNKVFAAIGERISRK